MRMKNCLVCGKICQGRTDKKFCSSYCRTAFHYEKSKELGMRQFYLVDRILKKNRAILKRYNKGGITLIERSILLEEGFNPNYFTHTQESSGQRYTFCYDYGYQLIQKFDRDQYLILHVKE